jgi:hypothetical protein
MSIRSVHSVRTVFTQRSAKAFIRDAVIRVDFPAEPASWAAYIYAGI